MDGEDVIGWGCPVCLSVRTMGEAPSSCCGLVVTMDSPCLFAYLDLDGVESGDGMSLTVEIRPWLRGAWEPAAEAAIMASFESWRDAALGDLTATSPR